MRRRTLAIILLAAVTLLGGCVNVDLSGIPGIAQAVQQVRPPADPADPPQPETPHLALTETQR